MNLFCEKEEQKKNIHFCLFYSVYYLLVSEFNDNKKYTKQITLLSGYAINNSSHDMENSFRTFHCEIKSDKKRKG